MGTHVVMRRYEYAVGGRMFSGTRGRLDEIGRIETEDEAQKKPARTPPERCPGFLRSQRSRKLLARAGCADWKCDQQHIWVGADCRRIGAAGDKHLAVLAPPKAPQEASGLMAVGRDGTARPNDGAFSHLRGMSASEFGRLHAGRLQRFVTRRLRRAVKRDAMDAARGLRRAQRAIDPNGAAACFVHHVNPTAFFIASSKA